MEAAKVRTFFHIKIAAILFYLFLNINACTLIGWNNNRMVQMWQIMKSHGVTIWLKRFL